MQRLAMSASDEERSLNWKRRGLLESSWEKGQGIKQGWRDNRAKARGDRTQEKFTRRLTGFKRTWQKSPLKAHFQRTLVIVQCIGKWALKITGSFEKPLVTLKWMQNLQWLHLYLAPVPPAKPNAGLAPLQLLPKLRHLVLDTFKTEKLDLSGINLKLESLALKSGFKFDLSIEMAAKLRSLTLWNCSHAPVKGRARADSRSSKKYASASTGGKRVRSSSWKGSPTDVLIWNWSKFLGATTWSSWRRGCDWSRNAARGCNASKSAASTRDRCQLWTRFCWKTSSWSTFDSQQIRPSMPNWIFTCKVSADVNTQRHCSTVPLFVHLLIFLLKLCNRLFNDWCTASI